MLRTFWFVLGDGYQALVFSELSSRKAGLAWRISGGRSGQIGGPPLYSRNRPETARSESCSCSAVNRRTFWRQSRVLSESILAARAARWLDAGTADWR